ncbi:MAG: pirin family protein [Alphaproteobacteria bacterium]|nr:pirin family protein [Alphaproteobacteria bacterium]
MITVYPYENLGRANFGWLDAHYHFSFARYHNPDRMGFGVLRVINDDIVKAGAGFDPHAHSDMEIITFVRSGAITHRDSQGNLGRTDAGNVQVMSAGTGIQHSEFNRENEDTTLYQIWIVPKEKGIAPRWDAREFSKTPVTDALNLLVSGRAGDKDKGALYIHQDAAIYGGTIPSGKTITHPITGQAYMLVSSGTIEMLGETIEAGAGVEITEHDNITITAKDDAEVIVIEVPAM